MLLGTLRQTHARGAKHLNTGRCVAHQHTQCLTLMYTWPFRLVQTQKRPPDTDVYVAFWLSVNTNTPPTSLQKVTNKHTNTVCGTCPKQSSSCHHGLCWGLSWKTGKLGKQFHLLSALLHAHVRSALLESNKIPSVLSAHPLSGECTWSPAQTCHSEEASPIPQQSFAFHFLFSFCFNSRSCVLSKALLISPFVFQWCRVFPKNSMAWYERLAHLPGVKTLAVHRTGGVAFREDKPGWRLGEIEWVAPSATVTTAPVMFRTVRWWSEEVAGCDWDISVWQTDDFN